MAGSQGNGWDDGAEENGAEQETPPDRTSATSAHGVGKKLVQFSSGLSRPFIQRPVMTMLLTASIIVFGILTYNQLAVKRSPGGRLSGHPGKRLLSRREPGNDGEHHRHPVGKAVHPDSGTRPNDKHELAGQHPDHSAVRS